MLDADALWPQIMGMSDTDITEAPKAATEASATKIPKSETREFLGFVVKLIVTVLLLRTLLFAPFSIPSESMQPKLLVGDYLLVTKWNYGYSRNSLPFRLPLFSGRVFSSLPERGTVVVFKAPPSNEVDFIKRVIGVPGDRIQMKGGQLFLNGTAVPKKRLPDFLVPVSENTHCYAPQFQETASDGAARCRYPRFQETLPNGKSYEVLDMMTIMKDDTEEFVVPPDHLFMMGDNRDNSQDSRFSPEFESGIGLVPVVNLVGRAWFIAFSTDGSSRWYNPISWFTAARLDRPGTGF
jgi:signal peptidase I